MMSQFLQLVDLDLSLPLIQKRLSGGVLSEKVFLEISQNSQENTCARVSFLIKLQASKFLKTPFFTKHLRTTASFNPRNKNFIIAIISKEERILDIKILSGGNNDLKKQERDAFYSLKDDPQYYL